MADVDFLEIYPQNCPSVTPAGIYIATGNDVASCFQSAENRVQATAAAADVIITKWWECRTSNFKILRLGALDSVCILTGGNVTSYFPSTSLRVNVSFWTMFWSRFLDSCSTDFEKVIHVFHFPLDIFVS